MNKKLILVFSLILVLACNLPFPTSPTPTSTLKPVPPPSPTPSGNPGLVVRGRVTFNGVGLEGVEIYKRFNAYPAEEIATTNANGYYESQFINIPGDEMISIEAQLAGYTFDPSYYYWRHYHGYEITTCDFVATQAP